MLSCSNLMQLEGQLQDRSKGHQQQQYQQQENPAMRSCDSKRPLEQHAGQFHHQQQEDPTKRLKMENLEQLPSQLFEAEMLNTGGQAGGMHVQQPQEDQQQQQHKMQQDLRLQQQLQHKQHRLLLLQQLQQQQQQYQLQSQQPQQQQHVVGSLRDILQTVHHQLCGYASWLEECSQQLGQLKREIAGQVVVQAEKLKDRDRKIQGLEADKQQLMQLLVLDDQQLAVIKKASAMAVAPA